MHFEEHQEQPSLLHLCSATLTLQPKGGKYIIPNLHLYVTCLHRIHTRTPDNTRPRSYHHASTPTHLARPLPRCLLIATLVILACVRNLRHQGVIWVGVREQ